MKKNSCNFSKPILLLSIVVIELPFFVLILPRGKTNILLCSFLYLLICAALFFTNKTYPNRFLYKTHFTFLTIITSSFLALQFYHRWSFSGGIRFVTSFIKNPQQQSILIIAMILAFLSIPGIDFILSLLLSDNIQNKIHEFKNRKTQLFLNLYIFLTSVITITLNSECSPLYPFNTWGDPNCMMTVGKSVLRGYVPYRDLYEQKGPLLLFIHTAGAAISFNSFTGIWILEIIFCFFFLYFIDKTAELFCRKRLSFLIPILGAVIYSRWAFQTGDTAEEFCLPMLCYGVYIGAKWLLSHNIPTKREFILFGVTAGCVFWIKYSMMGFYAGWAVFFIFYALNSGQLKKLLSGVFSIIIGYAFISAPILLYFVINRSISDLFTVYFYNLIFIYTKSDTSTIQNLHSGFEYLRMGNIFSVYMFLSGLIWLFFHKQRKSAAFLVISFAGLFFFIFFSAKRFIYYGLIFSIFSFFGLFWITDLLNISEMAKHRFFNNTFYSQICPFFLGIFILCFFSRNMPFLDNRKEDLMQYQIKERIEQSGISDPTILEYETASTGVNTAAGLIPKNRFFCNFNILLEDMKKDQQTCFEEACADFVIIQTKEIYEFSEYEQYIHLGGYEGNIHDTKRPYYYHLYQRK